MKQSAVDTLHLTIEKKHITYDDGIVGGGIGVEVRQRLKVVTCEESGLTLSRLAADD